MQGLPQVGDILDDTYRIESLLGQGGFGAVYLARQISMDRQVAIKVLVAHAMNVDEMIERFRREVMAVRNLQHPNTIRIYDFRGDREDGLLYYAMEFIKGDTLKDEMKGPMPLERVIHILRQILKSLSEAHSFGIVHRDLKPANIMIADLHGETDFVKVVDFGIAKIVGQAEGDDDNDPLTSAGVLVGTLRYMAPEQITGQGIGPPSDLYALALIGVEMLTGKSVFEGTGRWEVLHKQISDDPVDIPQEVITSPLGPVFQKALEKRLEKRYGAADQMLKDLDELLANVTGRGQHLSVPGTLRAPVIPAALPAESTPAPGPAPQAQQHAPAIGSTLSGGDESTMMVELPENERAAIASVAPVATNPPLMNPSLSPAVAKAPDSDTGPLPAVKSGSKAPLIGIGVLVLLALVVGGGYFVMQGSGTRDADATQLAETQPVQVVAETPPKKVESPPDTPIKEAEMKWVRITTPGVQATLFDGEKSIDKTPVRVSFTGSENYVVRAEGFEDFSVKLDSNLPEELEVALVKITVPEPVPVPVPTEKIRPTERVAQTDTKSTSSETKVKTTPRDTQPAKVNEGGWVDVKTDEKKEVEVW